VTAYFIVDVVWRDDTSRQQYLAAVGTTLSPYGGRAAVAGPPERIKGDWHPERVQLEFENVECESAWCSCAEY
jgi:uncharacterized protein (DUF1330 family)